MPSPGKMKIKVSFKLFLCLSCLFLIIIPEVSFILELQMLVLLDSKWSSFFSLAFQWQFIFYKHRVYHLASSPLISALIPVTCSQFHKGYQKTLNRISTAFYWSGMKKVQDFLFLFGLSKTKLNPYN